MGNFKHKYEQCSYWRGEQNESKKRTLLLLASIVWLIAGFNIIRIGILSYTGHVTVVNILLSALVFAVFWSMVFYKLVIRHTDRIQNYEDELQFFWHFFDKKSFLIMAFMMTFWNWSSSLPFCTGCVHRCVFIQDWEWHCFWQEFLFWSSLFSAGKKVADRKGASICLFTILRKLK